MAGHPSNVVTFNRNKHQKIFSPVETANLVSDCTTLAITQLKKLMQGMFDNVDDFLFDLADKAETNADQTLYFDAMREIRLQKNIMETYFFSSLTKLVNESLQKSITTRNVDIHHAVDDLLLVDDDELEQSLATTNMISKAHNLFRDALYALEQRFDHLVDEIEITKDNNPLGPANICNAFKKAVDQIESGIKVKLIVHKLFERFVVQKLDTLYLEINNKLKEAGILPHIKIRVRKQVRSQVVRKTPNIEEITGTPLCEDSSVTQFSENTSGIFSTLQHLLSVQRSGASITPQIKSNGFVQSNSGNETNNGNTVYQTPDVLVALSSLQNTATEQNASVINATDLKTNIADQIGVVHGDRGNHPINPVDADTIDIVSMMFDFILDDPSLPSSMKALISRLQIPMLKVAILDKEFFSKKTHPARLLLNELATAGIGWDESSGKDDPLLEKINSVVNRVLAEFNTEVTIFSELLEDFQNFKKQEQARIETTKKNLETAKIKVAEEIESRIAYEIDESFRYFLTTAWRDVLTYIYERDGDNSVAWHVAVRTMDDLIWSIQPKVTAKERQKFVKVIPQLLNSLQDGLTMISHDPEKKKKLFQLLEKHHITALRGEKFERATKPTGKNSENVGIEDKVKIKQSGETATIGQPDSQPQNSGTASSSKLAEGYIGDDTNIKTGDVDVNDLIEEIVLEETPTLDEAIQLDSTWNSEYANIVKQLDLGTWVEFTLENGKSVRGKLAWKSDFIGEYTFVDRKYKVVADKTKRELTQDFFHGKAALVENVPLFDRALDAVINGLQKYTNRNQADNEEIPLEEM
jgi:hypothetical protein